MRHVANKSNTSAPSARTAAGAAAHCSAAGAGRGRGQGQGVCAKAGVGQGSRGRAAGGSAGEQAERRACGAAWHASVAAGPAASTGLHNPAWVKLPV